MGAGSGQPVGFLGSICGYKVILNNLDLFGLTPLEWVQVYPDRRHMQHFPLLEHSFPLPVHQFPH